MKLEISKENGNYEVRLDGETCKMATIISREVQLFPGQTAELDVYRSYTSTEAVLEIVVEIHAERNGERESRRNRTSLTGGVSLSKSDIPATFPIGQWIAELTAWAKKIPLREEVIIEF